MTSPHTAFFFNPLSHTVATHGSILETAALDKNILRFSLKDFSQLAKYVNETAAQNIDTVFIEGGDGTIQGVLTEIILQSDSFKSLPNFVLLPGGMTNLVASNIGLKRPTPKKVTEIVQTPERQKSNSLPLLRIDQSENNASHFGFLLSTGALPAATQFCLDEIHTQGIGGSAAVRATLLKVLFGPKEKRAEIMTPTPIQLRMNNNVINGDHLTSVATTLPKLIIGINPFWGTDDGPVHLTFVDPDIRHKFLNIARMFKPKQSRRAIAALERDGFRSWNIEDAIFVHDGPLVLDGEVLPLSKGPIKLSASQPLNFLS